MNTLNSRLFSLFGIILLSAIMAFSFTSCQQDADSGDNNNNEPQIPSALQNTEWTNSAGEKISFDKDSVTITPKGGTAQKFPLKDTSSVNSGGIDQTILYFKDSQSPDNTITFRNGNITSVNFSIIENKNNSPSITGWNKGSSSDNDGDDPNASPITDFEIIEYTESYGIWASINRYKGNGGDVIIPSIYNGKPIAGILREAFSKTNYYPVATINTIVIPDSIDTIFVHAFKGQLLTSITIGANVIFYDPSGNNSPSFENNFDDAYNTQFNKAKGTYTWNGTSWSRKN